MKSQRNANTQQITEDDCDTYEDALDHQAISILPNEIIKDYAPTSKQAAKIKRIASFQLFENYEGVQKGTEQNNADLKNRAQSPSFLKN